MVIVLYQIESIQDYIIWPLNTGHENYCENSYCSEYKRKIVELGNFNNRIFHFSKQKENEDNKYRVKKNFQINHTKYWMHLI